MAKLLIRFITPDSEGRLLFLVLITKNIIKPGAAIPLSPPHRHIHSKTNIKAHIRQKMVESRLGKIHVNFAALVLKQISPFN